MPNKFQVYVCLCLCRSLNLFLLCMCAVFSNFHAFLSKCICILGNRHRMLSCKSSERKTHNNELQRTIRSSREYNRITAELRYKREKKKNEKIHTEQNKSNSNNNRNWTMSEKWKRRRKCTHKMKKKERIKTVDSIRRSEKYWNDRKKHWGTKLVKTKHEDWGTTALKSIHHALDVVIAVVWLLRTFKWLTNTNAISKLNHSFVNVYLMLS